MLGVYVKISWLSRILIMAFISISCPVMAADIRVLEQSDQYGCIAIMSGVIDQSDVQEFSKIQGELPRWDSEGRNIKGSLCLNSPGGSLGAALMLYDILEMPTSIPPTFSCESACAIIFEAGRSHSYEGGDNEFLPDRTIWAQGKLGLHAPDLNLADAGRLFSKEEVLNSYSLAVKSLAEIARRGVYSERMFSAMATTPPSEMHYVDIGDILSANIKLIGAKIPEQPIVHLFTTVCNNVVRFHTDLSAEVMSHSRTYLLSSAAVSPFSSQYALSGYEGLYFCDINGTISKSSFDLGEAVIYSSSYADSKDDATVDSSSTISSAAYLFHESTSIASIPLNEPSLNASLESPESSMSFPKGVFSELSTLTGKSIGEELFSSCWLTSSKSRIGNVSEYVNLRSQPEVSAVIVAKLQLGEPVKILQNDKVIITGKGQERQTCINACQALRRDSHDMEAQTQVQWCVNQNFVWYEVAYLGSIQGWISRKFLQDID